MSADEVMDLDLDDGESERLESENLKLKARIHELEAALCESEAIRSAIADALAGKEMDDFALSFGEIRAAADLYLMWTMSASGTCQRGHLSD